MTLRCLVVDDEPLARRVLEGYIEEHPRLTLTASCKDAVEASTCLESRPVDLIFLDINMPRLDGISFLKSLDQRPAVVLTTAYREYAVEAFELAATDYLLKPVSLDSFLRAVGRVLRQRRPAAEAASVPAAEALPSGKSIFLKVDNLIRKVRLDELLYLEAYGNYVKVFTDTGMLLTKKSLADFESLLPAEQFVKVHRSFVVAFERIEGLEGNQLLIGGAKVPVSRACKGELLLRMQVE